MGGLHDQRKSTNFSVTNLSHSIHANILLCSLFFTRLFRLAQSFSGNRQRNIFKLLAWRQKTDTKAFTDSSQSVLETTTIKRSRRLRSRCFFFWYFQHYSLNIGAHFTRVPVFFLQRCYSSTSRILLPNCDEEFHQRFCRSFQGEWLDKDNIAKMT